MKTTLTASTLALLVCTNAALAQGELPFVAGERLHYRVSVGKLGTIGHGTMSVDGPVDVRGTQTLVLRSEVKAQVAFLKSVERAESWIDPTRMAVLRYQKTGRGSMATLSNEGKTGFDITPKNQNRPESKTPVEINSTGVLFWRRPTLAQPIVALPSGLQRFTSVFGMGTGGATALGSPEVRAGLAVAALRADADLWRRCRSFKELLIR